MSFAIYRALRQSTAVDHAVSCSFTEAGVDELVIARVNVLEVWQPSTIQGQVQLVTSFEISGEINSVSRFRIGLESFTQEEQTKWGHRLPEPGLDCLVLSFDEAKISLVCFDPNRPRTLRTIALFNFEETARGSELRASKVGLLPTPPNAFGARAFALVDPEYRAIATIVYSSFIAVIPIRQVITTEEDESKAELIRVLAGSDDDESSSSSSSDDSDMDDEDREEEEGVGGKARHQQQQRQQKDEQELTAQQLRTNKPVSQGGRVLKRKSQLIRECGNDHPMFGTPHLLPLSAYGIGQHTCISAAFAESCFTPTLMVLYSNPTRTWAPRLAVYRHTCNVAAIALCAENPLAATKAWLASALPHDSLNLIPVKHAGGAALVVTTNALIYVNAVPRERVTMAVNAFAVDSCQAKVANPLYNINGSDADDVREEEKACCFTLTASSASVWISNQTLLCVLARGELLKVCLSPKGGAGGRNLVRMTCKLVGAIGGTLFTCAALLRDKQLLFFGSRSTDCAIIAYRQEEQVVLPTENKRIKLEQDAMASLQDNVFGASAAAAGEEEDVDYSLEEKQDVDEEDVVLTLDIVDYLPVLGPITDMDFCDTLPTNPAPQTAGSKKGADDLMLRRDVDLITVGTKARKDPRLYSYACGYRVNLRNTLALLECSLLSSLHGNTLLVSESKKTRVFTLVNDLEMVEMKQHGLCSATAPTLFACALPKASSSALTLQVLPKEIRIVSRGGELRSTLAPFSQRRHQHIVQVAFESSTLLLLLSNATVLAFTLVDQAFVERKDLSLQNVSSVSAFSCPRTNKLCICVVKTGAAAEESGILEMYEDAQLIFRSDAPLPLCPPSLNNSLAAKSNNNNSAGEADTHRAGVLLNSPVVDFLVARVGGETNFKILLFAALGDGELCVYERRTLAGEQVVSWHKVNHGVITRGLRGRQSRPRRYAQPSKHFRGPLLHSFFNAQHAHSVFFAGHRPCLVFCHLGRVSVVPLASSVACTLPPPLVPVPLAASAASAKVGAEEEEEEGNAAAGKLVPGPNEISRARGAIHAFCAIGSLLVFALRAPEPAVKSSDTLKATALWFCTSALSRAEDLSAGLPASSYALPVKSWNCTHVVYLPQASRGSKQEKALGLHAPTFAMISSRDETLRKRGNLAGGYGGGGTQQEEEESAALQEEEEAVPVSTAFGGEPDIVGVRQRVDICRAPDYHLVCASFALEMDERAVSIMTTDLDIPTGTELYRAQLAETDRPQHQGVIVVGTGFINARGEDASSKGRILVFKLEHEEDAEDEVWAQLNSRAEGRPSTKPVLKLLASEELRGPISALASLDGKILAATGNMPCSVKLLTLSSHNQGLIAVGFYDAPTCVVSMNVIREQFVLLGDMNKSIQFIRWKDRRFHCLGKSFDNVRAFASEFVVDGNRLLLTASDDEANLRVWHYDPEGQFLKVRGEMNIGVRVGKMKAKRLAILPPKQQQQQQSEEVGADGGAAAAAAAAATAAAVASAQEQARWCLTMGTLAGGLSSLVPLEERVFRRLDLLQQAMVASALIPRNAGLHPLQCAQPRVSKRPTLGKTLRSSAIGNSTIIDGRIICKFVDLEKTAQIKLAMSIGSTVESILDTLLEIDLASTW